MTAQARRAARRLTHRLRLRAYRLVRDVSRVEGSRVEHLRGRPA
ncbi:hypothetical protein [Streptacidiphilus rugosus]|nr:hypothetical protein [Streptacidiphilus rugosus]